MNIVYGLLLSSLLTLMPASIYAHTLQQYLAIQYNYLMQKVTGNYAYTLNTTKSRKPYDELMQSFYNQLNSFFYQTKSSTSADKALPRNNLNKKFEQTIKLIKKSTYKEKIAINFIKYFPHFFDLLGIRINPENLSKLAPKQIDYIFDKLRDGLAFIQTTSDLNTYFKDLPGTPLYTK